MLVTLLLIACKRNTSMMSIDQSQVYNVTEQKKKQALKSEELFDSAFLSYLKFTGQVEIEVFKIINPKFKETQKIPSQLYILSQLLQLKVDPKSLGASTSIFYNCYKIDLIQKNEKEIDVQRSCEQKKPVIARLRKKSVNEYNITFFQSLWSSVIGESAILNQKDKVCIIKISDQKVHEFVCENTLLTVGTGSALEEIRLSKYFFNRTGKKQIEITGGRYRDFTERSKINITVPEEGKIQFKEVELHVKDDFEEEVKKIEKNQSSAIPPVPSQGLPKQEQSGSDQQPGGR